MSAQRGAFWNEAVETCSIDGIVCAVYEAVSFAAGGVPDWTRFRGLFDENARLWRVEADGAIGGGVEDFIRRIDAGVVAGAITSLEEREVRRRTEVYGGVAQVLSTYERSDPAGPKRGLNALSLFRRDGRWWIASLTWTDEDGEEPLPPSYLPSAT